MPDVAQLRVDPRARQRKRRDAGCTCSRRRVLVIVVIPRLAARARHGHAASGIAPRTCRSARRTVLPAPAARLPRRAGACACHPVQLCAVPPAALAGLEAIVARAFGGSAALTVESPVAYGDEDALAERCADRCARSRHRAVQSRRRRRSATAHGAFVRGGGGGRSPRSRCSPSSTNPRFARAGRAMMRRLAQRRAMWRELLTGAARRADLRATSRRPTLRSREAAIDAALSAHARRSRPRRPIVTDSCRSRCR